MKRLRCVVVLAVVFLTPPAIAQVPPTISYQAILMDANVNVGFDGNVNITFARPVESTTTLKEMR